MALANRRRKHVDKGLKEYGGRPISLLVMRGLGAVLSVLAVLGFPGAVTASPASKPDGFVPGEVVVRFAPGTTTAARAELAGLLGAKIVERLPLSGLVRVRLEPGMSIEAAAAAFERQPGVRYAEPNHRYRLFATPNDLDSDLWALNNTGQSVNGVTGTPDADIDAPEAWDVRTDSSPVTVAVVDTGVDYTHSDLTANIWTNDDPVGGGDNDGNGYVDDLHGYDFMNGDSDPMDDEDHGTHVSGTIGARGNNGLGVTGVGWQAKIMALKACCDADGSFPEASIVQSFYYACANGAKVVNGSFGGSGFSQAILDSINACPNTLFVFAAGNEALNNDGPLRAYPCSYVAQNIVCVAASTSSDTRAPFSNYGVTSVDLAAPGDNILSTIPGNSYAYFDGTSMAAPHVAGAAALVLAERPALTTAELKRALLLSAEAKSSLTGLVATGARLNVRQAFTQEVAAPAGLAAQSTSPSYGRWSNVAQAVVTWGGASDTSGIDGYSYAWSPDPTFSPDESKDVEENVTSNSATLSDGRQWFHLRVRDGVGNWTDAIHLGPFMVDSFPPVRPTLSSPTHRAGVASTDKTVEINWITLGDSLSGLDGYSIAWGHQPLVTVDETKELEEGVVRATSPALQPGAWWFGIRARDNAGNWTDAAVLGPFVITGTAPVCTVPRLRGLSLAVAKRTLAKRGCALGRVSRAYSRRVARGRIVGQKRAPGLRLRRGAKVAVTVSKGRRRK